MVRHVTLEHDGKAFHIIDSSTNGTFLNDKKLPKKHVGLAVTPFRLRSFDVFRCTR